MERSEINAIVTLCLMAAYADSQQSDAERENIKMLVSELGEADASALYHDVILGRATIQKITQALPSQELRSYALAMAVSVCDTDGDCSSEEAAFLEEVRLAFGLPEESTRPHKAKAAELPMNLFQSAAPRKDLSDIMQKESMDTAFPGGIQDIQRTIIDIAILNGALELQPQSIGMLALLSCQKLVMAIGEKHNRTLDKAQVKELLSATGVYFKRKGTDGTLKQIFYIAFGGVFGSFFRSAEKKAEAAASLFGSTYAAGKLAELYCSGGQTLQPAEMSRIAESFKAEAAGFYHNYEAQVRERAMHFNISEFRAYGITW